MAKNYDDDEERRPFGFWRFMRGVVTALIVSAVAITVLSVYVLPPPVIPEPVAADTGEPKVVDGIEVSDAPAYSGERAGDGSQIEAGTGTAGGANEDATQGATGGATGGAAEDALPEGPAMVVNSAPYEGDLQQPLVAVVLDDTGAQPLLHGLLFSIDLPVTIGVTAGTAGDVETAKAARTAGFEVVAQLALAAPGSSDGSSLEYTLSEADAALRTLTLIQRLPMAVAVARTMASPAPPDRQVLRGVSSVVGPLGYAYLDIGVAPGETSPARASGDAASQGALVEVSRHTIPATASAAEAHAVLDQASADAAERGWAVVVAAPGEPLVQALLLWGGEGEGALARLAPLTAVIRKQIGAQ